MQIEIRPSLLILASLVFGYVGLFLDGTVIKYQITHDLNSVNSLASEINQQEERVMYIYQDHYGANSQPCRIFRVEDPSPFFQFVFFASQWFARAMNIAPFFLGLYYTVQRKVKLWKFFVVLVLLTGVPITMLYLFSPFFPPTINLDCDRADLYKVVSIYPYWPKLLLSLFAILFGYLSLSSISKAKLQEVESL